MPPPSAPPQASPPLPPVLAPTSLTAAGDATAKETPQVLTFIAVIDATIETFDREAYKSKLAALLTAVSPADITLQVSAP